MPTDIESGDRILSDIIGSSIPAAELFCFCFISKGRPKNVSIIQKALFADGGDALSVCWFVGKGEEDAYRKEGAKHIREGGGLCASRNAAIDYAQEAGKYCIQLSDDIHAISFLHHATEWTDGGRVAEGWISPPSLAAANLRAKGAQTFRVGAVGAASLIVSQMMVTSAKLGGVYPNANPGTSTKMAPVTEQHFCVGDFFVVDPSSQCRFDETLTLKEDYDFTAVHLHRHGRICRLNRLLLLADHYVNSGGAVAIRSASTEHQNIAILRRKWPGAFLNSPRGETEVRFYWDKRDVSLGGTRHFVPDPDRPGRAMAPPRKRKRGGEHGTVRSEEASKWENSEEANKWENFDKLVPTIADLERTGIAVRFEAENDICETCDMAVGEGDVGCSFCNCVFHHTPSCLPGKHAVTSGDHDDVISCATPECFRYPVTGQDLDDWCCPECWKEYLDIWGQQKRRIKEARPRHVETKEEEDRRAGLDPQRDK